VSETLEVRVGDPAFIARTLADDFAREAAAPLAAGQRFSVAIPGGSVAEMCFPTLATLPLDWSRVEFLWVDERAVSPTHPDSNYGLAKRLWLDPAGVPATRVHRVFAERDADQSAREYAGALMRVGGLPVKLDYVLLGVGEDGHVASLFPGRPIATYQQPIVLVEERAPKPPLRRITVAMPVITNAERVAIVATGAGKAGAIAEALSGRESSLPVASVVRRSGRTLLLLDEEAAAGVPDAQRQG
jgi:6-phosphogluconolactonase